MELTNYLVISLSLQGGLLQTIQTLQIYFTNWRLIIL